MFNLKKDKKIQSLTEDNAILGNANESLSQKIKEYIDKIKELKIRVLSLEYELQESKKRETGFHIDIIKSLDNDSEVMSYIPTDPEKRKQALGELSKLHTNKYLKDVFAYFINGVANMALRKQVQDYSAEKAKDIIDGALSIQSLLEDADTELQASIERERPITQEEQSELIQSTIKETITT